MSVVECSEQAAASTTPLSALDFREHSPEQIDENKAVWKNYKYVWPVDFCKRFSSPMFYVDFTSGDGKE